MKETIITGKIIIVDDEESIVWALKEILIDAGYEVFAYSNPLEVLDTIKKQGCDILLTDIRMPEMDGIELISKVRKINPDIDVIIITAYGSYDTAVDAIKYNVLDYISKPFDILKVKNIIDNAFKNRKNKSLSYKENSIIHPNNNRLIKQPAIEIENKYTIDCRSTAKDQKHGDFYDILKINEDKYAFILGNINTNESTAHVLYIMIKDIIRQEFFLENMPSHILKKIINILNQREAENIKISFLIGFLEIKKNIFTYSSYNFPSIPKIAGKKCEFEWIDSSKDIEDKSIILNQSEMLFFITPDILSHLNIENLIRGNFNKENFSDELFDNILTLRDTKKLNLDFTFLYVLFDKSGYIEGENGYSIYPAIENSIAIIDQEIENELSSYSFDNIYPIIASVNEILINIILYAYEDEKIETNKQIYFKLEAVKENVIINIKDKGKGFDFYKFKQNMGITEDNILNSKTRGLCLADKLMDNIEIISNINGTHVNLKKFS